jgi:hypothetical protein
MRYTVVWDPPALRSLFNLWFHAPDQQDVADASNRIDVALADDPERKGQPFKKFWTQAEPPLAVLYMIIPDDRMVRVLTVKRI